MPRRCAGLLSGNAAGVQYTSDSSGSGSTKHTHREENWRRRGAEAPRDASAEGPRAGTDSQAAIRARWTPPKKSCPERRSARDAARPAQGEPCRRGRARACAVSNGRPMHVRLGPRSAAAPPPAALSTRDPPAPRRSSPPPGPPQTRPCSNRLGISTRTRRARTTQRCWQPRRRRR